MSNLPIILAVLMFFIARHDLRKTNMAFGNRVYYNFMAVVATYYVIQAVLGLF